MQTLNNKTATVVVDPSASVFPLVPSSNKRYLVGADGNPYFVQGDGGWSIEAQLTRAQVDTYLNDRKAKNFTAVLFEAMEHKFSSQTPAWKNAEGNVPFTNMTDWTTPVEAYWSLVDYIVNGLKSRGMLAMVNPAYWGFNNSDEGWSVEILAQTPAKLQAYGAWLANRYTQGNVLWVVGTDTNTATPAQISALWNVVVGIRSVRPNDVVAADSWRTFDGYSQFAGQPGFNCNTIYTDGTEYGYAATAYGRPGPMPFVNAEARYDGEAGGDLLTCTRQPYWSVLSGAFGAVFGNNPVWGFGEPHFSGGLGAGPTIANSLSTPATLAQAFVKPFFTTRAWHKLVPQTGTVLVTSALGSGTSRIAAALASDNSFAMIGTPGSNFTVNMAAIGHNPVVAQWYNPADGTYATVSGSPFANTGSRAFTAPGFRILVLS